MAPHRPDHPSVPALERAQEWLLGFHGPTALVWGTRDPILGRALSRHEKQLPEAIVRTTEAGHFLQEEVPEVLAQAIREVAHRAS
jgi:haloalkane dehalogenase